MHCPERQCENDVKIGDMKTKLRHLDHHNFNEKMMCYGVIKRFPDEHKCI